MNIARRKASVLIIVVALLVILSLIGVSFLSAARTDRYSSQQNVTNTQIDMLLDGVVRMTQAQVEQDVFGYDADGNRVWRPLNSVDPEYSDIESPATDAFLAERIPVKASSGDPMWAYISGPIDGDTSFESPANNETYPDRAAMLPDVVTIAYPDGTRDYPGLLSPDETEPYLAADADGDGIADAGLFQIPVGALDGVTYYAAVRVVDNSAAINVNTAWSRASDFAASGSPITNLGYFPSSVGLREILSSYDPGSGNSPEIDALNEYRFGGEAHASLTPLADTQAARTDFSFISQGDALFMQLGRRLDNPGYNVAGIRYRPLGVSEMLSLAYRFCLVNPNASRSTLESIFSAAAETDSLYNDVRSEPYGPNAIAQWYENNFDYSLSERPVRALLTTRNPASNLIRKRQLPTAATDPAMKKTGSNPHNIEAMPDYEDRSYARTSINTADFGTLWRAYFETMVESSSETGVTVPEGTASSVYLSTLRDPRAANQALYTSLMTQVLIRSAQAAANAIDMRDGDNTVSSFVIPIELLNANGTPFKASNHGLAARVYGYEPQPYITEVYVQTNPNEQGTATNPSGYYAIELHNPYSFAIDIKGWRIYTIDHDAASYGDANLHKDASLIVSFDTSTTIPANGYVILENYNASATVLPAANKPGKDGGGGNSGPAATARPASARVSPGAVSIFVPNLPNVCDKEMMLVRPHAGNGAVDNQEQYVHDFVPIDQFDFTGFKSADANKAVNYHYVRAHGVGREWHCVYSGGYDAKAAGVRHAGIMTSNEWKNNDPWFPSAPSPAVYLGGAAAGADGYTDASFPSVGVNMPSQGSTTGAAGNAFPFAAFPTAGDGMYVPFVGNCVIGVRQDNGNEKMKYPIVLNSISTDAGIVISGGAFPSFIDTAANPWAERFVNYFTAIHNPADDYLPNIAASSYGGAAPAAVKNSSGSSQANSGYEDTVPIQGLININTASWKVLSALPMVANAADNESLAKAIVAHRYLKGSFDSIFDLNDVVSMSDTSKSFQNGWGTLPTTTAQERSAMVRKISNLITTRSDSFTCYVLVQGWRNTGTSAPELVSQRRAAFIIDRSVFSETSKSVSVVYVPSN